MLGTIYKIISKSIIDLNIKPQTVKLTELTGEIIVTLFRPRFLSCDTKSTIHKSELDFVRMKKKKKTLLCKR